MPSLVKGLGAFPIRLIQLPWTPPFPSEIAAEAAGLTNDIGDRSVAEFRADVADDVRRFLRERYSPGGRPPRLLRAFFLRFRLNRRQNPRR